MSNQFNLPELPEGEEYTIRILPYDSETIWIKVEPLSFAELMDTLMKGEIKYE